MPREREKPSREKQGAAAGLVGLCLNVLLGAGKLFAGFMSGSAAVLSDAANNLTDAGNSGITVGSFLLGGRKADREHPYGHGRYEYIASLIIGVIILFVGAEFLAAGVKKIVSPSPVTLGAFMFAVMGISIAVKLFMGVFYMINAHRLSGSPLRAAAWDSFFDCLVTGGVMLGSALAGILPPWIDGAVAVAVSLVILFGGGKLVFETVGNLLGKGCDKETADKINALVMKTPLVVGCHDLHVHDYGPGRMLASVHAEFDRDLSITEAHDVIDALEHRAFNELGIELVVHCDPIDTADLRLNRIRHTIKDIIRVYDGSSIHDLDADYDERAVAFHLKLKEKYLKERDRIIEILTDAVSEILPKFSVLIELDIIYDD